MNDVADVERALPAARARMSKAMALVAGALFLLCAGAFYRLLHPTSSLSLRLPPLPASAVWARPAGWLWVLAGVAVLLLACLAWRLQQQTARLHEALGRERSRRKQAESERERAAKALGEAQRLEVLGQIVGGVLHDFNNLLTVIVSASHHAQSQRGLHPAARESLGEIDQAAVKAAQLTRELLALGRKDSARPVLIDVSALVARLRPMLRRLLPSDIALEVDERFTAAVFMDRARLERVLINLVVNARDAIDGRGRVTLGGEPVQLAPGEHGVVSAGEYVRLWVSDDGRGMDEATRARLFEPFFTTKSRGRGSGLGLSLVQSFVRDAGGRVVVESREGVGTTVSLYLPACAAAPRAEERVEQVKGESALARTARSILVVEDDGKVRAAIVASLSRVGFIVHQAADGDAALALLEDGSVRLDLVLVDAVMPGASARSVIERARARVPAPRVVLCSGYLEEELSRRGLRTRELACVPKPFTPLQLLECIERQLGAGAAAASA